MSAERAECSKCHWPLRTHTDALCIARLNDALADAQRKRDEDVDQTLAALDKAEQRASALSAELETVREALNERANLIADLHAARERAAALEQLDAEYGPIRAHLNWEGKSFKKVLEERDEAEQRAGALEAALRDLLDSGVEVMDEHDTVEVFVSLLAWDCARAALARPASRPEGQ